MSISGVTLSPLLASLLQNGNAQTTSTATTSSSGSQTTASDSVDWTPAYLLSLGQQQSKTALLGYSDLGKLVKRADASLAAMDQDNPAVIATFGSGSLLQERHQVDVKQLAQAQILATGSYASSSQTVAGTGTLTVQGGSYDPSADTFTANADPVTISIPDGSLDGIADAINAADVGLTASVVKGTDGRYQLQVTGQTGAANAFKLSGIAGLTYDPSATSASSLQATQTAADALYIVDGGAVQRNWSNTGVAVTSTITADLTATGTMTVSVPFGFNQAFGAAQTLATAVNTLLAGLGELTGSGDPLAGDTGPASQLGDAIGEALGGVTGGPRGPSNLADIGITVQDDGTLAVDTATLQDAYSSDPVATRTLLDKAADAVRDILSGAGGASSQIESQVQALVQTMMAQTPSLADFLNQSASFEPSLSGLFGTSQESDLLQTALGGSSGLAAALGQSEQGQALLSALGVDSSSGTTDGQDEALLEVLAALLADSPQIQS